MRKHAPESSGASAGPAPASDPSAGSHVFQFLIKHFVRGLLFVVPVAATIYAVVVVFNTVDGWINVEALLNRRVPGAGFVLTAVTIWLVGFLASNFLTRSFFRLLDRILGKLPLVRLLYNSLKDVLDAFVGEKKRFDRPVRVRLSEDTEVSFFGFLTREDLASLGMPGRVAVYVPQSYNFAGNLVSVPAKLVTPIEIDSKEMMAFIVSGGISGPA